MNFKEISEKQEKLDIKKIAEWQEQRSNRELDKIFQRVDKKVIKYIRGLAQKKSARLGRERPG